MQIDVFNGDADGICALVQLRLARPAQTQLVTGIKRDIQLLEKISAQPGDEVTVLDISLEKNRLALDKVLAAGASVFYVDHHQPGEIPNHPNLTTLIDTDANICTSLLVNQHLQGKYLAWAVTAAFGDNLLAVAEQAALPLGLGETQLNQLKDLGTCINYNGYGNSISDLHFPPESLYRELAPFASPFDFIHDNAAIHQKLINGYQEDMNLAMQIKPEYVTDKVGLFILPDEAWARRISGVYGNELANLTPSRAHAVFSFTEKGDYQISVRAPLTNKTGADELCSAFPTGGGRKGAAGINHLPFDQLPAFIAAFEKTYA
ncbi:acetyltransferase [Methylosoma difficile]